MLYLLSVFILLLMLYALAMQTFFFLSYQYSKENVIERVRETDRQTERVR